VSLSECEVPPEALAELRGYAERLVLVDGAPPPRPAREAGRLAELGWRARKRWRTRRSLHEIRRAVQDLLATERFDVMLVAGINLFGRIDGRDAVPMVLDWCDADSLRLRQGLRYASVLEWPWRMLRYGQVRRTERLLRGWSHVAFISPRDRDAAHGPGSRAAVVPNGVDVTFWQRRGLPAPCRLVFTGVLDYPPNDDAARYLIDQVAPRVRRRVPGLEVVIAGRNPSAALRAAAARAPGVTVTGDVPDLRPYLDTATVFVAPMRFASGMQNKLLEAMAMELPVVTTPVAADGLRLDPTADPPVRVGRDADQLAAHVIDLLVDAPLAQRLGADGRRYVSRFCDWDRSADMLNGLCLDAAS
jgi:glycosyltransferase involved in cell wall biosynthesis